MRQGMAAGTATGGMGTTITMVTTTPMTIHMAIPTNMDIATITATQQPPPLPPAQPQPVGAP